MVPLVGICGRSKTGKTTLACKLIEELKNRGYRIAAIKHTVHKVDIDQPGKDSSNFYEAGALAVALASGEKVAMYMGTEEQMQPHEVSAKFFPQVDLVLVEGFSDAPMPRIGVVRGGVSEEIPEARGLIGIVTDMEIETDLPVFSFEETAAIADLVEQYIKRKGPKRDVTLFVNGRRVFIKPFIKDFFLKTISAMVDSLKGTGGAQRIDITIDKPQGEPDEDEG